MTVAAAAMPGEAVVDASVAVKWVLEEAGSDWARGLPGSGRRLVAPALLWVECANALWRIARTVPPGAFDAARAFGLIGALPLTILQVRWPAHAAALRLGMELDHPTYDCLYLALALERGAALATADRRFLGTIARTGVLPPDRVLTPPAGS